MTDTTTRPATRRREQTRSRLLEAAHAVFAEVGMDAASVEMICERAGFTRGAFYSNFESKDELFLALIAHLAEAKIDEVAVRVRSLAPDALGDLPGAVRQIVGASMAERMEPQLISEIRAQALRDPRMAAAYLGWQTGLRARIAGIIQDVVDTCGMRPRIPVADLAELLLDVSEDTCTRAAMEGRTPHDAGELLNERIERLVSALVDLS